MILLLLKNWNNDEISKQSYHYFLFWNLIILQCYLSMTEGYFFLFFSLRCTINTMCHKLLIVEKTTGLMSKVILTMRNIINYQTAICWERYFYFYAWNIVTSTNNRWQWMAALRVSGRFKTSAVPPTCTCGSLFTCYNLTSKYIFSVYCSLYIS